MPVSLLLAPAAHGKTAHALARIQHVRADEPLAPITVLFPNQIQLLAFRQRLAHHGGALGVALFTPYSLYAELLARVGQPVPELRSEAQIQLLRAVAQQPGALSYFAPLRDKPGFAVTVREALEELKRARVDAKDFVQATVGLGPRLTELATLYSTYQQWLRDKNWADPEGLGWLAALALEQHAPLGRDTRLLIVDGFDEFNPTQLAVLAHLAARAHETLITLTGDPHRPHRLAHRRFHRAEENLRRVLGELEPITVSVELTIAPTLLNLEHQLFETDQRGFENPAGLTFLEAQTRAAEARAALRWLKQRVVEDGVPLRDTALIARTLEPYRAFVEETAREFGLPLHTTSGAPLIDNPLISALLMLMTLPLATPAFRPRAVVAVWRSPYFDWAALGLPAAHAATLDAVARVGRVVGGVEQWREGLARLSTAPTAEEDDTPPLDPAAVAEASAAFEIFVARLALPAHAPLRTYIAWIENLIGAEATAPAPDALNLMTRARAEADTAPRDLAALRAFKEVLRSLVTTEAILNTLLPARREAGDGVWEGTAFIAALREAVQAAVYQTQTPTPNSIFFASVLDARGLSFRAVAVLGLAEGDFPLAEREMPLLREADRAALGERNIQLESRLRGDEVSIFYEAITRAREYLLLCRPYLADDGQRWEPSAYWREAHRRAGEPPPLTTRPEDRLPPAAIASPVEWVEHGYDPAPLARGLAVLQARLKPEASGPHEGDLSQLPIHNYPATWSASRLEGYGTCGFYFYLAHTLHLEPRAEPEEGYDARALGNMYHGILENLYRAAPDATNVDELLTRLPEVAHTVFATAPERYGFRPTALWAQQQAELLRILRETVAALAEVSEGWTPRYFEQKFGDPPLSVPTPAGEVRVRGFIDRIDVNAQGQLRVIDYKASGSPITATEVQAGRRLQLPLYALAARDALHRGEVVSGFYWHIGKAAASSLKLENFEGGLEAAFEVVRQHLYAHTAGIRAGRFQPTPPPGGCPAYCPAVGFCWRYKKARD